MRTIYTLSAFVLFLAHCPAQTIQWMHDAGSTPFSANERGDAVDADADGNAYVLGHLAIDSQFSGLPVPAHMDGCLAKYSANGTVQWVKTFGGPGFVDMDEHAVKVSTADNAVYVCGAFRTQFANPTIIFDTDTFTYVGNSRHGFLAKYDLNGNFQWMRHGGGDVGFGGNFNDLDIDDQGRIVAVGNLGGPTVFEGQTLNYDGGILARYLPDGTLVDLHPLNNGSTENQQALAVEVALGTGNIYVGGAFFGNIALDGFSATSTAFNIYVLKLDDALTCQWLNTGGANVDTYGAFLYGTALDAAENVYITGKASGLVVPFGPYSFMGHTFYDHEAITAKLDAAGTWQWLRHGGSEQNDVALDILADALGNTVITGYVEGNTNSVEFDGIQLDPVGQSANAFMARYDPDGAIVYATLLGGGSDDTGAGLALANDSTFYLTGTTWGSTPWLNYNFQSCCADPNLFIAKLNDAFNDMHTGTSAVSSSTNVISIHPNPVSDRLTVRNLPVKATYVVLDGHGRVVEQGSSGAAMDASSWAEGLYVLHIMDADNKSTSTRFVVAH
ncbi:MAG: T9SS type A sorting domain-containing protein [Flavobacteriales bacterium]